MDELTPLPPRRYRLQGWLVLAVLTAAILATFGLLAWKDLGARHDIAARQGHDTTWFIGRNVSERFRVFDRELIDIVAVAEASPAAASDAVREQVSHAVRTIPHVLSVGLIDADGVVVRHSDRRDSASGMSVADRPYFKDARAALGGRNAVLSEPLKGGVGDEAIIGLVRPLRAPDGNFAGAVFMAISAEAFDLLAGLPNLPKGSAIAIHRRDGINLFRAPLLPDRLGQDLSKTHLFTDALPKSPVGVAYTPSDGSAIDGSDRLLAYRTLDDWPLVVVVGIPRNEIIAGWTRDWTRNGLLVGIALIGFSWLAMILQRQITSRLEAELALSRREIEHRQKVEEELRRWATTDALTGLANRRHFIDVAEREMQRAQRYGRPMSVLVFDVDHFKLVNDHHGHAAGDRALKAIAAVGLESLRESDLLGRLGGEEFGVLLPEADLAGGAELAERLRAAIAAAHFTADGEPLSLSVSIGCGEVDSADENIDCILARADQALYRAKNGGRNRVEIASSPCRPNRVPA